MAGVEDDDDDFSLIRKPPKMHKPFRRPPPIPVEDTYCRNGYVELETSHYETECRSPELKVTIPCFESPVTPLASRIPPVAECPDSPILRSWDLARQDSLTETKLLMTTTLKRTTSLFLFGEHFEYIREIGRGSASKVYEGQEKKHGVLYAIKTSKQQFHNREEREYFMREVEAVAGLTEHPNVVKYYRCWQQDLHVFIQMELCEGGNFRSFLDQLSDLLPESKVWSYISQIASGLKHIHASSILHLDIKPENILLDKQGVLKIGDFSLAVTRGQWDWQEGDGGYLAPELLREEDPSSESDIYSFGAMVYELATGKLFPRSSPERDGVRYLTQRSNELNRLMASMLHPCRDKRPSAASILECSKEHIV
ncbi:hypothetical protein AMTRI_Chr03g145860 [Amborella trichopoda]|uniref:probable protein kinase DDB_G0291842 isoform X1 n=1 Tax=Amborella trichopoda TaxID=13333 RepID=UPI0009BE7F18|nr:probable protein kinase DDB_G0291842 isoform X1 [Amborella trichopoda]|eukprot:XP_020520209.1 probable protein kinase DDB_G0291842 isoform X1 [Amborella trichopoda]